MPPIVLHNGPYEVSFRPDCTMLCSSLKHRGEEFVAWPRTITEFRHGAATAIPLLHPWANRLARRQYAFEGTRVDLTGVDLPTDPNGLPIHGNCFGVTFDVVKVEDTRVIAQYDYGAHADKLRAFPFPHVVTIDATVHAERGVAIRTEVRPTGGVAVPVSFGWHPYLRLPQAPRSQWELRWPACEHMEVDPHLIPTGARTPQPAARAPLGARRFDDHYALGDDRTFSISAAGRTLTVEFDARYPFAQLYVPPRGRMIAIEPMTAEVDALGRGTAPQVDPSATFEAGFTLAVSG